VKKKVLITGAAGFIGSHLAEFFIKNNYEVIGVDNLLTGNMRNLDAILAKASFSFIKQDICKKINVKGDLQYILHFASPASPKDYLKYPIETLRIGAIGTENILNLAVEKKSVVLLASTSEVYGDPIEHPQNENYFGNVNPVGPRGVYDEAKRYLEAMTIAYKKKYSLNTKIARIFNTYGPRMRINDGRAIPNFINQLLNNDFLTIYGEGKQTRSFCYIDDTIEGLYCLLKSDYNYPVNIGNPNECTLIELIKIIEKLTSNTKKLKFLPLPENDPKKRKPDIKLAKKLLNWEPKIKLTEGLKKTIAYYKNLK